MTAHHPRTAGSPRRGLFAKWALTNSADVLGLGRAGCLFSPSVFSSGSLGRFDVSMCRPRYCPSHFLRFLNVSVRGFVDTLKRANLCLRLWGFRHIDTLKRG